MKNYSSPFCQENFVEFKYLWRQRSWGGAPESRKQGKIHWREAEQRRQGSDQETAGWSHIHMISQPSFAAGTEARGLGELHSRRAVQLAPALCACPGRLPVPSTWAAQPQSVCEHTPHIPPHLLFPGLCPRSSWGSAGGCHPRHPGNTQQNSVGGCGLVPNPVSCCICEGQSQVMRQHLLWKQSGSRQVSNRQVTNATGSSNETWPYPKWAVGLTGPNSRRLCTACHFKSFDNDTAKDKSTSTHCSYIWGPEDLFHRGCFRGMKLFLFPLQEWLRSYLPNTLIRNHKSWLFLIYVTE